MRRCRPPAYLAATCTSASCSTCSQCAQVRPLRDRHLRLRCDRNGSPCRGATPGSASATRPQAASFRAASSRHTPGRGRHAAGSGIGLYGRAADELMGGGRRGRVALGLGRRSPIRLPWGQPQTVRSRVAPSPPNHRRLPRGAEGWDLRHAAEAAPVEQRPRGGYSVPDRGLRRIVRERTPAAARRRGTTRTCAPTFRLSPFGRLRHRAGPGRLFALGRVPGGTPDIGASQVCHDARLSTASSLTQASAVRLRCGTSQCSSCPGTGGAESEHGGGASRPGWRHVSKPPSPLTELRARLASNLRYFPARLRDAALAARGRSVRQGRAAGHRRRRGGHRGQRDWSLPSARVRRGGPGASPVPTAW